MRRTISMHVVYDNGHSESKDGMTQTVTRAKLAECVTAINLVDGYRAIAPAMRDIMDEQTVVFRFGTFEIRFELDSVYA